GLCHRTTFASHKLAQFTAGPIVMTSVTPQMAWAAMHTADVLRLDLTDGKKELLLAFSCKRRGFCPSCGGRGLAQTGAHLVETGPRRAEQVPPARGLPATPN